MGQTSYTRSVVDRNVVIRRTPVLCLDTFNDLYRSMYCLCVNVYCTSATG